MLFKVLLCGIVKSVKQGWVITVSIEYWIYEFVAWIHCSDIDREAGKVTGEHIKGIFRQAKERGYSSAT